MPRAARRNQARIFWSATPDVVFYCSGRALFGGFYQAPFGPVLVAKQYTFKLADYPRNKCRATRGCGPAAQQSPVFSMRGQRKTWRASIFGSRENPLPFAARSARDLSGVRLHAQKVSHVSAPCAVASHRTARPFIRVLHGHKFSSGDIAG